MSFFHEPHLHIAIRNHPILTHPPYRNFLLNLPEQSFQEALFFILQESFPVSMISQ